jgi:hypothetical protein
MINAGCILILTGALGLNQSLKYSSRFRMQPELVWLGKLSEGVTA